MNTAMMRWLVALMVWSVWAGSAGAARSANKSETRLKFVVMGETYLESDQLFFAARMVADEVNGRTDIMPDATIEVVRERDILAYDERSATVMDNAVRLCETPGVMGFSAELASSVVIKALSVCPMVPAFSVSAAGDQLSQKARFPLFWRYTSTWGQTIRASIGFFKYFGWTKVGILYMNYGNFPKVSQIYFDMFPHEGIEVAAKVSIEPYRPPGLYYDQIRPSFEFLKSTKLRIFVVIGIGSDLPEIMMAANLTGLYGRDYVWTTPQDYASIGDIDNSRWDVPISPAILQGLTCIKNDPGTFQENAYTTAWTSRYETAINYAIANEAALYETMNVTETDPMSERYPLYMFYDDTGAWTLPSFYIRSGYDAIWSLISVMDRVINRHNATAESMANGPLREALKLEELLAEASRRDNVLGAVHFTPNGDLSADPLHFLQYNSVYELVAVGRFRVNDETGLSNLELFDNFNWTDGRRRDDVPIDSPRMVREAVMFTQVVTRVVVAFYVLASVVCVASGVYIWIFQSARGIFHRTPILLCISAVGMTIALMHVFTLVGGSELPARCRFRPWPLALGLTVILSCIIAKSYRMHVIFQCVSHNTGFERRTVTVARLLHLITYTFFFMLALLLIQSTFFPYVATDVYMHSTDTNSATCLPSSLITDVFTYFIMTIIGFMIVVAATFAYINRILPNEFNDVQEITISVYIMIVLSVVGLAQGYMGTRSPTANFAVESAIVLFGVLLLIATLLGSPVVTSLRYEIMVRRRLSRIARARAAAAQRIARASLAARASAAARKSTRGVRVDSAAASSALPQPKMWEHFDPETRTVLRVVGFVDEKARQSLSNHGCVLRSEGVLALSERVPVPKLITLTLIAEPLFIIGFAETPVEQPAEQPPDQDSRFMPMSGNSMMDTSQYEQQSSLAFQRLDLQEPRYVPMRTIRSVTLPPPDQPWLERSIELQVRDRTVMLTFASTDERAYWADTIARALIRLRGASHFESSGQIVDVQEASILQVGA
ncbi:periplasmic binding protein-like I [Entophlyctis helioformis]|nr:periplasmic binding protein-like I [Entophlyctis helioformis]